MAPGSDDGSTLTSSARDDSLRVPHLVVSVTPPDGPAVEARLELRPLVVGSSDECDLAVADPKVSRRHCEIALTEEGVILRDLGSKNGTYSRKIALREAVLPPDEPVTLGDSTLVVRAAGAPTTAAMSTEGAFGEALGRSFVMRTLFAMLARAAATDQTIILLGESGSGKEVLARAIHQHSARRAGPFVVLDCSAVAANLIESEIFGYVRGAFTGAAGARTGLLEEANRGTLFIDEIGELPLDLQPKLLRALEARQIRRLGSSEWHAFDARVVAATHRNLRARVADGTFRQDLYYRLAVIEARVPSLRERKDDIPDLVERFLATLQPPQTLAALPTNALSMLRAHSFPGNVRELRNLVTRLVLFPDLSLDLSPAAADGAPPSSRGQGLVSLPLPEAREAVLKQFEQRYLAARLEQHGGNISRAADAMGVSRQLVHKLLDRYGMRAK